MRCSLAGLPVGMAKRMAVLVWLFFTSFTWQAQAGVNIAPAADVIKPASRTLVFEDAAGQLDIDQLLAQGDTLPWQPLQHEVANFGFTDSTWWLWLKLENNSAMPLRRLLELSSSLPDYVEAYVVDEERRIVQQWETGSRRAFSSRPVRHHTFVLPIYFGPEESRDVLVRLSSHDGLLPATPLFVMDDVRFLERTQSELMAYSLLYGGLLALLLYNLLTWLATRERGFFYSVLYLGAFLFLNFILRGFGFQYLWPERPHFTQPMLLLSVGLLYGALTLFSVDYLNLRRKAPYVFKLLWVLTGLIGLGLLPALGGHFSRPIQWLIPLGSSYALLLLGAAGWLCLKKDRLAAIFLVAWGGFLVGIVLYFLRLGGIVPYGLGSEYALELGAAFSFLLLAFGLAFKINRLKRDKQAAERKHYELQRRHTRELESKVQQRTRELEEANRKLSAMVRTDPLTGLLNRRQFETLIDEEIQRRQRYGKPLLFAMMDIDEFKPYNDTYGHQAGDEVLIEVAKLLKRHFRRAGDRLFRLGGEEFGILLEADSLQEGSLALERFRHALQQLSIPHKASGYGVVTGSFGLICCNDYGQMPTAMAVYQQADQAMYEAKQSNRNCVVSRLLTPEISA